MENANAPDGDHTTTSPPGPANSLGHSSLYHRCSPACKLPEERPQLYLVLEVPAAGFEPAHFGLKELARLAVWPELVRPARSEQKLISS